MRPASQLIEQGIRAYTRGALDEAERCWREAMALEPLNDRARSYLELLTGRAKDDLPDLEPERTPGPDAPSAPVVAAGPVPVIAAGPAPIPLPEPGGAPVLLAEPPVTPVPARRTLETQPPWAPSSPPLTPPPGRPAAPLPSIAPPPGPAALPVPPLTPPPPPDVEHRVTLSEFAPSPWDQGPAEAPSIVLDGDGGLDLRTIDEKSDLRSLVPDQGQPPLAPPAPLKPVSDVEVWMQGAKELHALGDFSGSLEMIEKILKVDPAHAEARAYLRQNESTLIAMYESKLGSMGNIPRLAIKPEEVLWLNLDHRAGFLLAQVDGAVNYEDLFALSGLPRLDTARILATLLQEGVISS